MLFSQEHNLILTNAEADKYYSEADEMDRKMVKVDEENDEEIDEEPDKEPDEKPDEEAEELEQANNLNDDLFQDFNHRPLIDTEEECPINDEILEEESSKFEGFDREIFKYPNFCKEDVVTNIRCFCKWRYKLPFLQVRQHNVLIYEQKAPSTLSSTKKAFVISPLAYLERVLNNLTLMSKMYIGPSMVKKEKIEFWYEDLWQDSPLFGEHEIKLDRVYKLKVDQLLQNKNLPNYHSNSIRHSRGNNKELWLVENDPIFIDPADISRCVIVWLCDLTESKHYEFYTQEVVYYFGGHWRYQDISKRYQLPCEFDEFIKPVLNDIKQLENGIIINTIYRSTWVVGRLGCVTADLPQGNNLADVKRHGANHRCRTCSIPKKTNKEYLATEYSLTTSPGPFNILMWDQHMQIPQDIYHSMGGKARTLLDVTLNILNVSGE
ncbi:23057_t:CDS:2, partial [Racocetra persica]